MSGKQFPSRELRELTWGDAPETYTLISDTIVDNGRWSIHHEMIFQFDGLFYRTHYSIGATECQDERPFEYDGEFVTCEQVVAVEKTVTVYEAVPA
ncbi:hypothetical protein [Caulobacter sp.]|uniref:hypothetical protein n=1 Tax=Caulobacter sp. TaxID=78 RepID=UPI0031DF847A